MPYIIRGMEPTVIHNTDAHSYEIFIGAEKVGNLDYSLRLNEIHFTHTGVDPKHQGKNLAAILTKWALNDVREQGKYKVVPVCSYTVRYMDKHPETQDLLLNPIEEAVAMCALPSDRLTKKLGLQ